MEYQKLMEEPDDIIVNMDGGVGGSWFVQKTEPEDIHQIMYDISIQNTSTTIHIDPPGGSENLHESGVGMRQLK